MGTSLTLVDSREKKQNQNVDQGTIEGTTLGTSYAFSQFNLQPEWSNHLFALQCKNADFVLHMHLYISFSEQSSAELTLTFEYRRKLHSRIQRREQINRRFSCQYFINRDRVRFTKIREFRLEGQLFPKYVWKVISSYIYASQSHNVVKFGNTIVDTLGREGIGYSQTFVLTLGASWNLTYETIELALVSDPLAVLPAQSFIPKLVDLIPGSSRSLSLPSTSTIHEPELMELQDLDIQVHPDGLNIQISLPPYTRRVSLCVARFGRKFRFYDFKSGRLIDTKGASIPNYGSEFICIKLQIGEDQLEASTRYAIKYSILIGEKWSASSRMYEVTTANTSEKPAAPHLEPIPRGFQLKLPILPPNAQHLTLWVLRENWTEFRVYDWKSKKIVHSAGSAIPIWDTGGVLQVDLEPETEYTIMYSLMQDDIWQQVSHGTRARTLPDKRKFASFLYASKCRNENKV